MGDYASYQVTSIEDRKKLFSLIQAGPRPDTENTACLQPLHSHPHIHNQLSVVIPSAYLRSLMLAQALKREGVSPAASAPQPPPSDPPARAPSQPAAAQWQPLVPAPAPAPLANSHQQQPRRRRSSHDRWLAPPPRRSRCPATAVTSLASECASGRGECLWGLLVVCEVRGGGGWLRRRWLVV